MVSSLTFKLIHFELIFVCSIRRSPNFFIFICPVFLAPFNEEIVISPLYILGSFV